MAEIKDLVGKTFVKVTTLGNEEVLFIAADGTTYKMYHAQDCCERVTINDINGDLEDLVGTPILVAEEVSNYEPTSEDDKELTLSAESCTWTFYRFATVKGYVTIRWFGESNGYYSESVYFIQVGVDDEW